MGSLGLIFGSFLTDKLGIENVDFVMDDTRFKKYRNIKRTVNNKVYDFNIVSGTDTGKPSDLVIFAVKSTSLQHAMEVVKNKIGDSTTIISLLNGIRSEEVLGEMFGHEKVLYATAEGMDPIKTGYDLDYTNMGYLCIGADNNDPEKVRRLTEIIRFFETIGFPYKFEEDVTHRMWSKFMLNVGVNQVVMIHEGTFATVQKEGNEREQMIEAMREVIGLAYKEGIKITEADLEFYVSLIDTLNPKGMPSMRHDGLHKIESEVEMFSGMVLELGRKHNFPTPVNSYIYNRIIETESRY
jgi:2-dehydropantoate 2-reductase